MKDPYFSSSPSLFTEVKTEERETGCRSNGVRPGRDGGDDIVRGEQALADKGKSNEEEGDAEEEPGKREHPDRRFEAEEEVPNDGSTEEDRANDVKLDISLPT